MRCPRWPSPGASRMPPNGPSQPNCVRAEDAESGHGKAATSRPGPRTLRPARVRVKPTKGRVRTNRWGPAPAVAQCQPGPSANQGPVPTRAQCQPGPSANQGAPTRGRQPVARPVAKCQCRACPAPVPMQYGASSSADRALRQAFPGAQWRATQILPWYAWRSPVTSDAHPLFVAAPRQREGEHYQRTQRHRRSVARPCPRVRAQTAVHRTQPNSRL